LPSEDTSLPDALMAGLDDTTVGYVLATRIPFEQLRQAAGQIAGVLVLATSGGRGVAGHPILELAREARAEAEAAIRSARVPPRGRHHQRHLLRCARAITRALQVAAELHADDGAAVDAVLRPLRAGYQELQWAAGALPGFEVVAFEQGCCATHPAVAGRADLDGARGGN
jgi:hypothetical protein